MLSRLPRVLALVSLACTALACRANGSFLLFGGSDAPQERLIESVRDAQAECTRARTDFGAAFHLYQRLTAPQAVELEQLADDFADATEACQDRGGDLGECIDSVQAESVRLFKGWSEELAKFSGDALRKKSETMMQETEARAKRAGAALERVRTKMEPVLLKLRDYGLFFHHNLNARAIATLEDTYKDFDAEFRALDGELEKAGAELGSFLAYAVPVVSGAKDAKD